MRRCVRCGSSFRPLEIDQLCCSEDCSSTLQGSLLPAIVPRVLPERREPVRELPKRGSRRPIFVGQRFVVFEWQLDQLARLLGPFFDDFDMHEWFYTLDARSALSPELIPQRDGGQWLQARTLEEAARRGLPVARGEQEASASVGKQTSRLAQAIANIKKGFSS